MPAPLYNITAAAGISWVAWLIFVDGVVSPNGPNATNVGSVPRVAYEVARGGTLPRFFLKLHPVYGTPALGLLASFILEVFFLPITAGGYGQLISSVNVASLVAYAVGPVAMGTLRLTAADVDRPFRLKGGHFWPPVAFILASLLLYWSQWPLTGEVLGVVAIGIAIYGFYVLRGTVKAESVGNGIWLMVYLISLAVMCYFGDRKFGGVGLIPFGWDFLVISVLAGVLYYWGVHEGVPYLDPSGGSEAS